MVETVKPVKTIREAHRSLSNYKTRLVFNSHVLLSSCDIIEDGFALSPDFLSEIRHFVSLVKNRIARGPDMIRSAHLRNLPHLLINTLAWLFIHCLSYFKVPIQLKTSSTVLLFKKSELFGIGSHRLICLLPVVCKLSLDSFYTPMTEHWTNGSHVSKQDFAKDAA